MKKVFFTLALLFAAMSFPMMAQSNVQSTRQTDSPKAKVEVRQGKQYLVLSTGVNTSVELSTITIAVDDETWNILDGMLAAPRGAAVRMKDTKKRNVDITLANVNSQTGLMFTSGSKFIAITKEEYEGLKARGEDL